MEILRNWYVWIVISCSVMLLGGILERMTSWPYISYLGYILFGCLCLLWSMLALIAWIKTKL